MKIMRSAGANLTILAESLWKLGRRLLWSSLRRGLSKVRMMAGRTVTLPITPRRTPLAITSPRSRPMVKVMKQRAIKPAMVVAELPKTELKVSLMASSIDLLELLFSWKCSR